MRFLYVGRVTLTLYDNDNLMFINNFKKSLFFFYRKRQTYVCPKFDYLEREWNPIKGGEQTIREGKNVPIELNRSLRRIILRASEVSESTSKTESDF